MIRVLHIDTGLTFRGGQRQVRLLIRNLDRFDIEQFLACPEQSPLVQAASETVKERFALSRSNLMRFLERKELATFVKRNRIDIIHAHDSHAHTLAVSVKKGQSLSIVVTRRSSGKIGFGSRTKYVAYKIKYVAISEHIKRMLTSGGVAEDSIEVISSMLDLSKFRGIAAGRGQRAHAEGGKAIVSAGALDRKKGYYDALKGMVILAGKRDDFTYTLYGDGPEMGRLAGFVSRHDLSQVVRMPGWHNNPAEYLRNADIFLSTSRAEGLNTSIIEAMAAGVPVVATDIPPHRESITHLETGLLFPPGDIRKMVEALNQLLDKPEPAAIIGQKAAEVAERFDCGAITERIYRVYADVVAHAG
ncbi:MAG: glycosyltransferase [Candidatus Zixiibacteriota bacterium]|nr:MAG: glycosyltransferase [candidate division Zixibacteria bacterium]